jgi:hypothetical protein
MLAGVTKSKARRFHRAFTYFGLLFVVAQLAVSLAS